MSTPQTTRRGLIGTGAAVLLAGATRQAAAVHIGAFAPAAELHFDAELLGLLAAFDQIADQMRAAYPKDCTAAEEAVIDEQVEPLREQQDALLDRICTAQARTIEGIRARARSLLAWDRGAWVSAPDDPDEYHDKRLIAALVRDLVAEA